MKRQPHQFFCALLRLRLLCGFAVGLAMLAGASQGAAQSLATASPSTSDAVSPEARLIAEIRLHNSVVHVGDTVELAAARVNDSRARFSWRLLKRPPRSHARIADRRQTESSFVADVAGTYVVDLTVRDRSRSATATLAVSTVSTTSSSCQPGPTGVLTSVNTIDMSSGQQGITVGGCTWNATQPTQFQVLYLYRNGNAPLTPYPITNSSTKVVSENQTYPVSQSGVTAMYDDFGSLPTNGSVLVLVALSASAGTLSSSLIGQPGVTSPPSLQSALAKIGAVLPPTYSLASGAQNCWASNLLNCFGYASHGSTATWNGTAGSWADQAFAAGSFSVIGVPGMSVGNAWYDSAAQRGTTQGPLIGYMVPDSEVGVSNASAYTFVFTPYNAMDTGQYAVVDSCAVTAKSNCAIAVGKQIQFQESQNVITEQVSWLHECDPGAGVNGLNVMVLDRITLAPILCTTVTSTSTLYQALQLSDPAAPPTEGSHEQYQSPWYFNDRLVVVIQSVGNLTPLPGCFPDATAFPPVVCPNATSISPTPITYANDPTLRLIDQLGGTPETFATSIGAPASGTTLPGAYPYALIGVASNLPWHGKGVESSPLISPGQPCFISEGAPCVINSLHPGRVRAALSRDRMARYTPQAGDPTGTANLDLYPIIYQSTVPWPYSAQASNGSAATVAAIAYIAGALEPPLGPAHCDIRSGYLNSSLTSNWAGWASTIANWTAPAAWPTNSSCSSYFNGTTPPSNFGEIVTQLVNEFNSVPAVYGLINNLKEPFQQNETGSIVIVQNVATQIYNTVKPQPTSNVGFGWLDIFDGVMDVLSAIPGLPGSAVFGLLGASGDLAGALLANDSSSSASGGPGSQAYKIHVEAQNLATQLTNQTTQQLNALGTLNTILLSDAGKLVAVGSQVIGNSDWQWSDAVTSAAVTFLTATTVQASYSALLPPTYLQWNLKPSFIDGPQGQQTSSADQKSWYCCATADSCYAPPFANAVTYNGSSTPTTYGNMFYSRFQMVPGSETSTTEAWSIAEYATSTEAPGPKPTTSLTNDIFGTGIDTSTNLVQGAAYPPAWYRSTFNPPGVFTCTVDSVGDPWLFVEPPHESTPPIPAINIGPQQANQTQG